MNIVEGKNIPQSTSFDDDDNYKFDDDISDRNAVRHHRSVEALKMNDINESIGVNEDLGYKKVGYSENESNSLFKLSSVDSSDTSMREDQNSESQFQKEREDKREPLRNPSTISVGEKVTPVKNKSGLITPLNASPSRNSNSNPQTPLGGRKRSASRTSSGKNPRQSSNISPASMIFRNLLIIEDDLRQQARQQKYLKWQYTSFLSTLAGVEGFATYELFLIESGIKGFYRVALQFTWCFIMITLFFFYISGQYKRTMVLPRRFFNSTNKGLRQFNVRLVKVQPSYDELLTDFIRFISKTIAQSNVSFLSKVMKIDEANTIIQFWKSVVIQSQPRVGAVDVRLVLSPRAFSAEVREGWEIYRDEFWAREGARRRKQVDEPKHK